MRSSSFRAASILLASACAVALTFDGLLTGREVPLYRDLLFFVVPFKHYLAERLQQGEIALWNPYVFLGTPFLAALQTGVLYPPSLLLLFGFPGGFCLFVIVHYLVALFGMWVLLRERGLCLPAAGVGSVTFALGGFSVSMLSLTSFLQSLAWFPWVLFMQSRLQLQATASRVVSMAAVLLLQILAGSPEIFLMTLLVAATWPAYRFVPRWSQVLLVPVRLGVIVALAAGLAAFQILPTAEYVSESARSTALSLREVTRWSLHPLALFQIVFPPGPFSSSGAELAAFFSEDTPWIYSLYLGVITLCLVAAALASGRERWYWAGLFAVGLVLALGDRSPIFLALYDLAPGLIGRFRFPEKFWFLSHLSIAVLAADGTHRFLSGDTKARSLAVSMAALLFALGIVVWFTGWYWPRSHLSWVARLVEGERSFVEIVDLAADVRYHAGRLALLVSGFLLFVATTLVRGRGSASARTVLLLLVLVDLVPTQHLLVTTIPWSALRARTSLLETSELRKRDLRVFHYDVRSSDTNDPVEGFDQFWVIPKGEGDLREFYGELWRTRLLNAVMIDHVATLSGADGIARDSDGMLRRALSIVPREKALRLLRAFSVHNLVGPVPLESDGLEQIDPDPPSPYFIYRLTDSLPIAYLVTQLREAPTRVAAFNVMVSSDFEPGSAAVVPSLPANWADTFDPDAAGRATVLVRSPERVCVRVETKHPALLVLNDSYFPGWEARVDGNLRPIVRANALVRGVVVNSGDQVVEFIYRPASLRAGALLSLASVGVLLFWIVVTHRRAGASPVRKD